MKNRDDTSIVLGSLRYKSAIDVDISLNPSLNQTQNGLLESDRNSAISLNTIYDNERQASTNFRFTLNVKFLYDNNLIGVSNYSQFTNNLFYVDNYYNAPWFSGYPQSYEFDLIRNDTGNSHIRFIPQSATTYNWGYFLSYPYENDYNDLLRYVDGTVDISWISGNGIPAFISNAQQNGSSIIQFRCFVKHGLNENEYVSLSGLTVSSEFVFPPLSGTNIYDIYSFGDGTYGSDEFIFNIIDIGYPPNFFNGVCLIKRVLDPDNLVETTSKYYVRKNKIITNIDDLILTYNGYQQNSFKEYKKYEFSAITPNNVSRVSIKNSNKTYNITNANDINITGLTDNNGRPITEIHLTMINRGYMGWFNYPNEFIQNPPISDVTPSSLKKGWYFNVTNNIVNPWWDINNSASNSRIPTEWYQRNGYRFFYNKTLIIGDIIEGDWCEFNQSLHEERLISSHYHMLRFNNNLFNVSDNTNSAPGYFYQTHFPITIRSFSSYIEKGYPNPIDNLPNGLNYSGYTAIDIPSYAFYSSYHGVWTWRDIYTYGYIDDTGVGVDYPYLNKTHYPTASVFFRLLPNNSNYINNDGFVEQPTIDGCE